MTSETKNTIFIIIRAVLVAALLAAVIYFVFIQNSRTSTKSIDEVAGTIETQITNEKRALTSDRFFKKYFDLNPADYDGVVYYTPVTNMDAEELLIVKLKDQSQADALLEAIEERASTKEQTFEGYAPEQYELCKSYIIDRQGNFILFVVGEDAAEVDTAFQEAL